MSPCLNTCNHLISSRSSSGMRFKSCNYSNDLNSCQSSSGAVASSLFEYCSFYSSDEWSNGSFGLKLEQALWENSYESVELYHVCLRRLIKHKGMQVAAVDVHYKESDPGGWQIGMHQGRHSWLIQMSIYILYIDLSDSFNACWERSPTLTWKQDIILYILCVCYIRVKQ